ncbi:type II secretion system protein N [Alkalimonas collagenimarina]|uniref:Type II secretion system protein N n=1 Tax=Alkalimonas collagenimarina TaxID=400390 RepID=A0ABT9GX25_9GAMM|nr:type II secretion system protein N [Alkalimonas collagenimarina]MDP4535612.1 type II secretion system protein N [Alkalimonas collagenimarina]
MRIRSMVLLGSAVYLLSLLILTPAAWWLKLAPLPPELRLGLVQGTLWQGQLTAARYQSIELRAIHWQLKPWSLLTGKLVVDVQAGDLAEAQQPYVKGQLSYGFSGVQLSDTLLRYPVAQLAPMLTLPLPIDADGQLMVDIELYRQGAPWCQQLSGQASWQEARLQPPTGWIDLQHIFATLHCEEGELVLLTDGQNPLGLDVAARLIASGQFTVDGTLKPDDTMPEEVHQAMQFVGAPDAEGRYRIRF